MLSTKEISFSNFLYAEQIAIVVFRLRIKTCPSSESRPVHIANAGSKIVLISLEKEIY